MYHQIIQQPDLSLRWQQIKESFTAPALWLVCLLMLVNWGFEAAKWQMLVRPLENVSFANAFKSVFAGCSITMLTPFRIGEYGGRILYLKEEHRLDAIPLTILGSISQLFITIIMGAGGLLFWRHFNENEKMFSFLPSGTSSFLLALSLAGAGLLIFVYLRSASIASFTSRIKALKKLASHIILLKSFSRKQLLRILLLSFLRYMVFTLQYILLLQVMQAEISFFDCFRSLTVFYLLMAMAPTIGFTELPVRAILSYQVLQVFSNNVIGIQAAALGIWVINLVVPAVAGSLLILGIKIMKEK